MTNENREILFALRANDLAASFSDECYHAWTLVRQGYVKRIVVHKNKFTVKYKIQLTELGKVTLKGLE